MKIQKLLKHKLVPPSSEDISGDEVLYFDLDFLVTRWKPAKSNMNIGAAVSLLCVKSGVQISKKYNREGKFVYYYCDMVKTHWDPETETFEVTDLIADLIVFPDSELRLIDLEEFQEAYQSKVIDTEEFEFTKKCLLDITDKVICGNFPPKEWIEAVGPALPEDF